MGKLFRQTTMQKTADNAVWPVQRASLAISDIAHQPNAEALPQV